ncbi:MAG: hypothetical protein ACR2M5_06815 [Nakamurella sp.]
MLLAIIVSGVVAVMWTTGTTLALHARHGQRFGDRGVRLPMPTRLLWCCSPILLALAANYFYTQLRDPARLATAAVATLVLLLATMLVPILVHNARLKQAR